MSASEATTSTTYLSGQLSAECIYGKRDLLTMTGHLAGIPSDDSAKKGCIYADDPMGHYPREGDSDSDALRVMRTKRIAAETR